MRAAILCPGPSLSRLNDVPDADLTLAVNRAALRFECQWWVFGDYQTFIENEPLGKPGLFTARDAQRELLLHGFAERLGRYPTVFYEDIEQPPRTVLSWALFSMTAAMALSWAMGARDIRLYGADLAGTLDFDGFTMERHCRTDARWANELAHLERLTKWLMEHGAKVTRGIP